MFSNKEINALKKFSPKAGVPEQHQLRILKDTVRNPMKGKFLGGPTVEEAKETLKSKFHFTDEQIRKLEASKKTAETEGYTRKNIDQVKAGDVILWDGKDRTVTPKDIKKDSFIGKTIFGDNWKGGHDPVYVKKIPVWEKGKRVDSSKSAASESAEQTYKKEIKQVEDLLNEINKYLPLIKKQYEKQLKDNPNSWAGIGDGADLRGLIENLKRPAEQMRVLSK